MHEYQQQLGSASNWYSHCRGTIVVQERGTGANLDAVNHRLLPAAQLSLIVLQGASFWRLATYNKPEWPWALAGTAGSALQGEL